MTRAEAKRLGLKRYYTGVRCIRDHVCERWVSTGACLKCNSLATAAWLGRNPDKHWRVTHPDRMAASGGLAYANRKGADYYDGVVADTEAVYALARRLSKETGVKHHVDHIVPLKRGGSHTPENLQVLTAKENMQKGAS